jgi:ligand-binding sensor domain-containing protein
MRAMAFDAGGNLWLSTCGGEVVQLSKTQLETGSAQLRAVDPDVVISGLTQDNQDIAFDADGNLWVADAGKVVRFNADRLTASDNDAPDLSITVRDSGDNQDLVINFLTFDAAGHLWATDFAGNTLAHIDGADLAGDGDATAVAQVSLVLSVTALLNRPAMDDHGNLWISYTNGSLVGLSDATLLLSSTTGSPTDPDFVLQGANVGSIGNVAFFPAAAGLPLYHAYP